MAQAQDAWDVWLNHPQEVCLGRYASIHAFFRDGKPEYGGDTDYQTPDSVVWTITPPTGPVITYRASMGRPAPILWVNPTSSTLMAGQTIMLDMTMVGKYYVKATLYDGVRNGRPRYVREREVEIDVTDCSMAVCRGSFTPTTNFIEDFGTFTAGEPRRAVTGATVEYQWNSNPYNAGSTANGWPLSDDWYTIYYNAIRGGRPEWDNVDDHTNNGLGGMMIANSSNNPKTFYKREVNGLCPGAKYNFSAWFINLNSHQVLTNTCAGYGSRYQYAGVTFIVKNKLTGAVIGQFYTGDVSMDLRRNDAGNQRLTGWQQYGGTVTLPPGVTDVTVEIKNNNPGGCGNDIAVDDIEFKFCAPYIYAYIDGTADDQQEVCPGATLNLTSSIDPIDYFTDPQYYWEYRVAGTGTWATIPAGSGYLGLNTNMLTIPEGLLKEGEHWEYRLMIIERGNLAAGQRQCYTPSTPVRLDVADLPEITVPRDSLCRGETMIMTAIPLSGSGTTGYQEFTFMGNYIEPWPSGPQPKNQVLIRPQVTTQYIVEGTIWHGMDPNTGQPRVCKRRDSITITVDEPPVVDLGPDLLACAGTQVTLDAGAANAAYGKLWKPSFLTTQTINVTVPNIDGDSVKPYVEVKNGQCTTTDTIRIIAVKLPNALIQNVTATCTNPVTTTYRLRNTGGTPVTKNPYTVLWEIVGAANGASLTVPAGLPNERDLINMPPNVPVRVRITLTANGAPCVATHERDFITYTRPVATLTDNEIAQCSRQFTLTAAPLTDTSTYGTWTVISGSVTIPAGQANNPNAVVTVNSAAGVTATVRWTVRKYNGNAPCPTAQADVRLTFHNGPVVTIPSAVDVCRQTPFTFTLPYTATNAPTHYDLEAIAPAMPGFVNIDNGVLPSTTGGNITITYPAAAAPGTYRFRLTVIKPVGTTDSCVDTKEFDVVLNTPSTTPTIGVTAASICVGQSSTLSIASGTLGSNSEWVWYRGDCTSGTAVEIARNVTSVTVSPTATTTYSVRAIGTTACGNTTCVTTTVTVYQQPAKPNAGPDQEKCNDEMFQLNATAPSVPGAVGTWTANPASVVFSDIHSPTSTARVFVGTTATVVWTITNGPCAVVSDTLIISNLNEINQNIIRQDQTICIGETPAELYGVGHPSSGAGTFVYRWQYSTTSATAGYTTIPGTNTENYQPGPLSVTTWFRRVVVSGACSDTSSSVQITVNTNPPTVVTTPANITVECNKTQNYTTLFGTPTFQHPLGLALTVTFTDNTVTQACGMTITRTWTATDRCGLSVSTSQTITVVDTTDPLLSFPGGRAPVDTTVSCSAIPAAVTASGTDNCTANASVRITVNTVRDATFTGTCVNNYRLIRTWTALDDCNNSTVHTQLITVVDTSRPSLVWAGSAPANVTVSCDAIPAAVNPTATDNCLPAGTTITPTYAQDTIRAGVPGACQNTYQLRRVWTATDVCGNSISHTQIITVQDNTVPTLTWTGAAPANVSVQCSAIPAAATAGATDNCTPGNFVRITYVQDTIRAAGACQNNYQLRRVWTATDLCGNAATHTQIVTVTDNTIPTITWTGAAPANVTVQCSAIPAAATATATDNCTPGNYIRITYVQDTIRAAGACQNNYQLRRVWTATDLCGNAATYTQIVTVQDNTIPTITWTGAAPANITVQCSAIPAAATASATDNCTPGNYIRIAYVQDTIRAAGACQNNYQLRRVWTATDLCGNAATHTQIVTVQDNTIPTITWTGAAPSNVTVQCSAIPAAATATATDNCTPGNYIRITYVQDTIRAAGACQNNYQLRRVWTATDLCGNAATHTQIVTVQDNTRPTLTWTGAAPADVAVECSAIPAAATATATDNCTPGNYINITYVQDTLRANGACQNSYQLRRVWTATDLCGNAATHTQIVTISDNTRPTLTWTGAAPGAVAVECNAIPAAATATATDNCTPGNYIRITYVQDTIRAAGACQNNYQLRRVWTATDLCGNAATHTQIVTVSDNTLPTLTWTGTAPANVAVECSAIPAAATATATDNCTPGNYVRITYVQDTIRAAGACQNNYQLRRVWTATDLCGNAATHTQIVTVSDNTRPTLTWTGAAPANVTAECSAIPAAATATATDNCTPGNYIRITYVQDTIRAAGACQNNYQLRRVWTATDLCGNAATHTQIVTVTDNTRPTLVWTGAAPANVTVQCSAIPAAATASATDNCTPVAYIDIDYVQDTIRAAGACQNSYQLRRVWTATDLCGNAITHTQIVTVVDNTRPTLTWTGAAPANVTVECSAIPAAATAGATDNCTPVAYIDIDYVQDTIRAAGACQNNYQLRRVWTATDLCGNAVTHTQIVTVQDNTRPTLVWTGTAPGAAAVECDAIPAAVTATATDNCTPGNYIRITYVQDTIRAAGACQNSYQLRRVWTATDLCGNAATHTQMITVTDNTRPTLVWTGAAPASVAVECNAIPAAATATATDNCTPGNYIRITYVQDTIRAAGACQNNYQLRRVWTATDLCGNAATHTQIVTVSDNTDPILTFPSGLPADVTVNCDAVPAPVTASATDNCTPANYVTITLRTDTVRAAGACISNYQLVRTWTARDLCGNTATHVQRVTVQDNTLPTLTWTGAAPANVAVECSAIPAAATAGATDNCSPVGSIRITYVQDTIRAAGACQNDYQLRRVWTATDLCGNAATHTQIVTVSDNTIPTLTWTGTAPANVAVQCSAIPAAATAGATDNCTPGNYIRITYVQDTIRAAGACQNNYQLRRVWTATDLCGNAATHTQIVTVTDNTRPTLTWTGSAPANVTVQCSAIPAAATASATDNCTPVAYIDIDYVQDTIRAAGACQNSYQLRRVWTATDLCGNVATHTQIVTVVDNTRPTLTWTGAAPANVTVECSAIPAAATAGATDNCTPANYIDIDYRQDTVRAAGNCQNEYELHRVWTATDLCGNVATHTQIVTVQDNTRPTLVWTGTAPGAAAVECDAIPAAVTATATDNCTPGNYIRITYVQDTIRAAGACQNSYQLRRVWTATDLCGNAATHTQMITVTDNTRPTLVWTGAAPASVAVECNAIPAAATATATDNCTPGNYIRITYVQDTIRAAGACQNNYQLRRVWTATDLCGNAATHTQIVTVSDNTDPILTFPSGLPADVTVNCDAVPAPVTASATDNCTPANYVTITLRTDTVRAAGACISNYQLVRTWTARDLCGNTATHVQRVTVQDNTLPTLTWTGAAPANVAVECSAIPAAATAGATDNCSPVGSIRITYVQDTIRAAGACQNDYQLRRVWTATDLCGNAATHTQIVTVSDNTIPTLTWTGTAPANVAVQCSAIPAAATATATDNCTPGNYIRIAYVQDTIRAAGACQNNYQLRRVWTATDLCGNAATHTQIVTVTDNTRPTLTWTGAAPANVTVECSAIPAAATASATDNCTPVAYIDIDYVQDTIRAAGACQNNYQLRRVWTATDLCGNAATHTQIVTVQDVTRPTLTWTGAAPANVTVECSAIPAAATAGATDNCTPVNYIRITYVQDTIRAAGACQNNYQLRRVWTATDLCGNAATHTQIVTVQDVTRPTLTWTGAAPANVTVQCDAIPAAVTASATDNCTPVNYIRITYVQDTIRAAGACQNNYQLRRVWTATDLCGNASTHTQIVTVQDNTRPTLTWTGAAPANVAVECNAIPAAVTAGATDNCTPVNYIRITYVQDTIRAAGACQNNYQLRRVWTATDLCGNAATHTQIVTVSDNTNPILTFPSGLPADVTVNCDAVPAPVTASATDNCTPANYVAITLRTDTVRAAGACISNYQLVRTWTARDLCGNTATHVQRVTVQDTTRPTLVWTGAAPANVAVECSAIPAAATARATDNCSPAATIRITYVQDTIRAAGACQNNYQLRRVWTATDLCGNAATHTQIVTVSDNTRPTLTWTGAAPANVTAECSAIPAAATASATDNCTPGNYIRITYVQDTIRAAGACQNNYQLRRVWTATDLCGNASTHTQIVTVTDNTRPTLTWTGSAPANVTVECSAIPAAATAGATDNCTPVNYIRITYVQDTIRAAGACQNNYQLRRVWTATDLCGNASTHTQIVTVRDVTRPTLTWTGAAPANVTVECSAIPAAATASATDNCTPVNYIRITYVQDTIRAAGACQNNYQLRRVWTATDLCGNASTHTQIVTVRDVTRPTLTWTGAAPANVTVQCDAIPAAVTAAATDNCTPVNYIRITYVQDTIRAAGACQNNYQLRRVWTATDLCGNAATHTQIVTVQDNTRPTLTWTGAAPANVTVECSAIPAAATAGATDNCTPVNYIRITYVQDTIRAAGACQNNYQLRRVWTATDLCGNAATHTQIVTVQDTQRPTFNWTGAAPADITVNCDAVPAPVNASATDNCTPLNYLTITLRTDTIRAAGACISNYQLVRTWTARDLCGNAATHVQRVTVQDTTRPTLTWTGAAPANVTVECSAIPAAATARATDNCSPAATIRITYVQDTIRAAGACQNNYQLRRVWTATDLCGNASSHTQIVTVQDVTRPTLNWTGAAPANVTVECSAIPAAAIASATDNCTPVNYIRITYVQDTIRAAGACQNNYQLRRVWTATDLCGNASTHTQIVTVQDNTRPTLTWTGTAPANVTVECSAIPAAATAGATDNCTPANYIRMAYVQDTIRAAGACQNNYQLRRVWTATDLCGNVATHTQIVTVQDVTRPTLTWTGAAPANVTVQCDAIPAAVTASATDNCTPVNYIRITYVQDTIRAAGACQNNYQLRRVWTATDLCGNAATHTQIVTVQDNTRPTLTWTGAAPANVTVECSAIPAAATAGATDNCTPVNYISITYVQDTIRAAGACQNNYQLRRVWTATDLCGNAATHTQIVTVQDVTRPTLTWTGAAPVNVTADCDAIPAAVTAGATDNCTPVNYIRIAYVQDTIRAAGACQNNYQLRRVWTATDLCGNAATHTQLVTVQDTTNPALVFPGARPANATVNCDAIPAAVTATATDNCTPGNAVRIVYVQDTLRTAGNCISNYQLRRTWTATDLCGNIDRHIQILTVQDTTKPALAFPGTRPANATVNCDAIPAAVTATATDNCTPGNAVRIVYVQDTLRTAGNCISNYQLRRTWTATDLCGNFDSHIQILTVQDTTNPVLVFTGARPASITVNCDAIPAAATATATDNCTPGNLVTVRLTTDTLRTAGNCISNYQLRRTWTATDLCGNFSTHVQLVTVQDTTKPVLVFPGTRPANVTVNCDAIPAAVTATATDNCTPGNLVTVAYTQDTVRAAGNCVNNYELRRTWTATDLCGNASSHVQIVMVQDTTKPAMVWPGACPANTTVNCDAVPAAIMPTATDNCTPGNMVTVALRTDTLRAAGACISNYQLRRTWTATDLCGNFSTHVQLVTVQDTTKPVFTFPNGRPADATVSCDAIPAVPVVNATDNCSPVNGVTVTLRTDTLRTPGACANSYRLRRTWTATDLCGNTDTFVQTLTVEDRTAPVFTMPTPADTTVNCDEIPAQPDLTAIDNCSPVGKVTILKNENRNAIPGACANNYLLIRTWTAIDECRNAVTVTQTITVVDTKAPVFTSATPADTTVNCDMVPAAPNMTATDNCSTGNNVTVRYNETRRDIPGACINNYQLIRTWTATDECGNFNTVSQTITVQDTTAPVFTTPAPANVTVECDKVPAQPDLAATDNCAGNVTFTKAQQRIDSTCANTYRLIRTWTATDVCGNATTLTQTIIVADRTKPVFTSPIPADTTVNCDAIPARPVINATDNCAGSINVVFEEEHIDIPGACASNYKLLRTWTANDGCGNISKVIQVITVRDTTRPTFTMPVPADTTVNCDAIPVQPDLTAADNCSAASEVTVVKNETRENIAGACANNYRLIRTWTATDACGNARTVRQVVTVQDTTRPVFVLPVPVDTTVNCNAVPTQPDINANDNCSAQNRVTIVKNERRENIAGACVNNYRLIRTWTATDECGNSAVLTQVVTVQDTTRPNFTMPIPMDATVNCDAIPTQPDLNVTDNCTATNAIRVVKSERREDIAGACANNYRLIRTWTATDECGNIRTVTQTLTVQDTTRPTFVGSTPADATVECSAIPVQPNIQVTDNCSASNNITVVKSERREDIPGACVNNYRLIRTWTATDECGNSSSVQQVLTVTDTTAPVFTTTTPADATAECSAIPAQPDLIARDNCSGNNVTVVKAERREDIAGACANNYRLIRTWTATDECGNSKTVTQVLTITDNTKPVFNLPVPANATVECSAIPVQPDLTATDNCSPAAGITIVKYERREDIPGACVNNYRLIRTWTATDECGNATTVTQTLTVQDTTAPVFTTLPPTNITLSCSELPAAPVMTATDNCSGNNVVVTYKFVKQPMSGICAYNYRLTRTWTATDECGNTATATQVITVMDTTKPTFSMAAPADTTVMCDNLPAPVSISATDNCTPHGGVTIRYRSIRETVPGACNYRVINIWTAIDACGNAAEMRQVVTVIDTVKPVIAAPPADITLTCGQPIPTGQISLTATDNCSADFPKQVQYTIDPYTPDLCNGYTIIRRWRVADGCGNQADDVIQRIIVQPCPQPELEAEVFTNCSTNPFITLKTKGDVQRPVYTLVGVTPANAVSTPMSSSNPRFNVNGATTASFTVRDGVTGCVSDTVTYTINYLQMPVVNLGSDTSLCGGNGMVLDAGPANFGYQIRWSTGETTQRIRITRAGTYKVTVSNGMCEAADSIEVGVIPMPLIDLKDTTICRGQSVKLDATVEGNATYLWSTGATSPVITVSTQERFWVRVTKLGCITIDTVNVTVNPPPDVTLSRDTSICPGQTVMLTVNTNAGRIQWATGETGNSIVVSRAGNYQVAVYRDNCVVKEAVRVTERPDIKLELGPDRFMCPGSSILIDARHADVNVYRWNDGDLNPVKTITQPGTYVLGVLDRFCDRYKTDSIKVTISGPPTVNLGNDTILCKGRRHILKSNAVNASRYLWSTGATTAGIEVTQPGTYTVTAFNDCGSTTDEITIDVKECDSKPEVPNAFSPNGDGKNDVFRPVVRGPMYDYELRIFNRWGEMVFISKDQYQGWDGTYKGRPVDVGTFVWWLTYKKATFGPAFIIKGDVTVIR